MNPKPLSMLKLTVAANLETPSITTQLATYEIVAVLLLPLA